MNVIGIIGGLGPQTTADFYMRLQTLVNVETIGSRPSILIDSIPITLELENENIIKEKGFENTLPYLLAASKNLEHAGADFIVLACNSLHIFEKEIAANITVPFLSMVTATIDFVEMQGLKKVGLLGTKQTVSSGMYTDRLQQQGIEVLRPNKSDQEILSEIIIRIINNTHTSQDKIFFKNLIADFTAQGSQKVILACSDLHILMDVDDKPKVIDSLEILAQHSAVRISQSRP